MAVERNDFEETTGDRRLVLTWDDGINEGRESIMLTESDDPDCVSTIVIYGDSTQIIADLDQSEAVALGNALLKLAE